MAGSSTRLTLPGATFCLFEHELMQYDHAGARTVYIADSER